MLVGRREEAEHVPDHRNQEDHQPQRRTGVVHDPKRSGTIPACRPDARFTVPPEKTDAQHCQSTGERAEPGTPGVAMPSACPCRHKQDRHGEGHGSHAPRTHHRNLAVRLPKWTPVVWPTSLDCNVR